MNGYTHDKQLPELSDDGERVTYTLERMLTGIKTYICSTQYASAHRHPALYPTSFFTSITTKSLLNRACKSDTMQ